MSKRLIALVAAMFCIGTSELLPGGMLTELSDSLSVSVSTTGLLITVYAATVAVAGPVVTLLTTRISKSRLCLGLLMVFVAGNIVIAVAPGFSTVLVGRVITASTHGAFLACAIVLAQRILGPEKSGKAVTTIQLGVNLATVLGIPLGAVLAQLGGWRTPYALIAVVATIAAIAVRRATAGLAIEVAEPDVRQELSALRNVRVGLVIAATAFFSSAMFAVITFFEPLARASGYPAGVVPLLLLAYGVASILGNSIGGRLLIHGWRFAIAAAAVLIASCVALYFLQITELGFAIGAMVFALATFALIPILQSDVLELAGAAPSLSLSANMSAFGGGAAIGSFVGGRSITEFDDIRVVPLAAAVLAAVGFVFYMFRHFIDRSAGTLDAQEKLDARF